MALLLILIRGLKNIRYCTVQPKQEYGALTISPRLSGTFSNLKHLHMGYDISQLKEQTQQESLA